jgi:ferredoxin
MLDRDEWGYPVPRGSMEIDESVERYATHARDACPLLALRIVG